MAELRKKLNKEEELEEGNFWDKIKGAASSLFESGEDTSDPEVRKKHLQRGADLSKSFKKEKEAEKEDVKESEPTAKPTPKATVSSPPAAKFAAAQRQKNLADMYQLKGNERKALEASQKEYLSTLEEFKKVRDKVKNKQATAKLAATLGKAFVQLLAGARGLKTGQDMSGLKFNRENWDQVRAQTNRDLQEQLSEIKQKSAADRGIVRAEFREKRAGQEATGRQSLEQAKELDRQRKEAYTKAERARKEAEKASKKAATSAEKEAAQLEADRHKTDENYILMEMELKPEQQETLEPEDKTLDKLEKFFIKKSNYTPEDAKKVFEGIKEKAKTTKGIGPWETEVYDSKKLKEELQKDKVKWQQFFDKRSKNKKAMPLS